VAHRAVLLKKRSPADGVAVWVLSKRHVDGDEEEER
jgi:hypothetical protein